MPGVETLPYIVFLLVTAWLYGITVLSEQGLLLVNGVLVNQDRRSSGVSLSDPHSVKSLQMSGRYISLSAFSVSYAFRSVMIVVPPRRCSLSLTWAYDQRSAYVPLTFLLPFSCLQSCCTYYHAFYKYARG